MVGLQQLPENTMPPMRASTTVAGGLTGQVGEMARYAINPDEALIITVKKSDADYQSIQLGTYWFTTPNPLQHQSSLNAYQARVDRDGYLRYVVSLDDPGVVNWLDPAGSLNGYIYVRWQGINTPLNYEDQPSVRRVPLAELARHLPADTGRVDRKERQALLALRYHLPWLKQ